MYQTRKLLRRKLRIRYPRGEGSIVLRTELDWDRDVEPTTVSRDKTSVGPANAGREAHVMRA